ncbi:MAG: hypothetical protein WBP18_09725, partial [Paracoccaceae bacterium]
MAGSSGTKSSFFRVIVLVSRIVTMFSSLIARKDLPRAGPAFHPWGMTKRPRDRGQRVMQQERMLRNVVMAAD